VLRLLKPCSGLAQACSPSAHVKAAAAHVQTHWDRNSQKKKNESNLFGNHISSNSASNAVSQRRRSALALLTLASPPLLSFERDSKTGLPITELP